MERFEQTKGNGLGAGDRARGVAELGRLYTEGKDARGVSARVLVGKGGGGGALASAAGECHLVYSRWVNLWRAENLREMEWGGV